MTVKAAIHFLLIIVISVVLAPLMAASHSSPCVPPSTSPHPVSMTSRGCS